MGPRRFLVTATTLAVVLTGAWAAPAAADGGGHGSQSVTGQVVPGGSLTATSPTLAKDDTSATLVVEPDTTDPAAIAEFDQLLQSIGAMTKQQKLLTCVLLYKYVAAIPETLYEQTPGLNITFVTVAASIAGACLRLAGLVSARTAPRASAARGGCGQLMPAVKASITKSAGGYTLTTSGKVKKKKGPLKVSCRAAGNGLSYTVKPRKKGQTLRQVVGKKLLVGLQSPADATTTVPVKVTFS